MAEIYVPAHGRSVSRFVVERGRGPFASGGFGKVYLAFTNLMVAVAVKVTTLEGDTQKARQSFQSGLKSCHFTFA